MRDQNQPVGTQRIALTDRVRELSDEFSQAYQNEPALRVLIQLLPRGGMVDFLLSQKATNLYQQRVLALFESLISNMSNLEEQTLRKDFLFSEEFIELFETCVEIVARSANENKRKHVAAFLEGTIKSGKTQDLSHQIANDLRDLQDFHLRFLASIPDSLVSNVLATSDERAASRVIDLHKLREIMGMDWAVLSKARADLERMGFIRYDSEATGWAGGDIGNYRTTGYFKVFRESLGAECAQR